VDPALDRWSDFHVAVAGAGAALGGLLVVALSVNIKQIAESRGLAARAAAAVATVVLGVVLACVALVPGLSLPGFGVVVLAGAAGTGAVVVGATRRVLLDRAGVGTRGPTDAYRVTVLVTPVLAFFVGGVLLTASVGGGLVAVAVGVLASLVSAVLFSWVALVEVLR
jgi:hypothetical protein